MRGADDRARARAGEVIVRQLAVMERLVDDLLDVARIRSGAIELRREVVDLRAAVDRVVDTLREEFAARRLTLTLAQSDTPLPVDADVVRLEQVVTNLLGNALKYTPPGGRVAVTTTREDGEAVVTVRDTGAGIDPALLPSIFDLFVQGQRAPHRPGGGLGIGLTLVRTLVEMQGGRVEALSRGSGQGSTFRVVLPGVAAAAGPPSPAPSSAARGRLRILVVDDHEDAAEMLTVLLQGHGHEVEVAHDGPAAVAAAVRFRPRLVLLDIGLPGMDGYAVAAALRRVPDLEPLTIVALTGYGQAQDRERARAAGCDAHLVKPVAPETLGALLQTVR
jgi:two-component system CheB/CheR fusion protein